MSPYNPAVLKLLMTSSFRGLDAEAKYFLVRAVWLFGNGDIGYKVGDLSKIFGMSPQKLADAIGSLTAIHQGSGELAQYFVELPNSSLAHVGKGRPGRVIRLDDNFCDALLAEVQRLQAGGKDASFGPLNDNIVRGLICGPSGWIEPTSATGGGKGRPPDRTGAAGTLGRLNCFLLAVLWSLASESGVVAGLGTVEISRISGLSRTQVERQIDKLQRLGYIRQRYGGVSSAEIFGRAAGFIFLDPINEGLQARVPVDPYGRKLSWHRMPLKDSPLDDLSFAFQQASALSSRSTRLSQLRTEDVDGSARVHVARMMLRQEIQRFYQELGVRSDVAGQKDGQSPLLYEVLGAVSERGKDHAFVVVCKYAGDILYDQGERLLQASHEMNPEIVAKIRSDVLVSGQKGRDEPDGRIGQEIAMWFYRMAYDLASMVCRVFTHQRRGQMPQSWVCGAIVPELRSGEVVDLAFLIFESRW